jgi:hypothetical protein
MRRDVVGDARWRDAASFAEATMHAMAVVRADRARSSLASEAYAAPLARSRAAPEPLGARSGQRRPAACVDGRVSLTDERG